MASSEATNNMEGVGTNSSDFPTTLDPRQKPDPQWHQDMESSHRGSRASMASPLSPPTPRFQSISGQYSPLSPATAFRSSNYAPRPEPFSTDSFHSTASYGSGYSNERRTSDAGLLGSFRNASAPVFPPPPALYDLSRITFLSHVRSWNPMWMMYILFALGVVGALSHHAFYASLAGSEANDQLLMLRYGAALAYLTKASLVASVVLAFRQQIWATFREKLLSIAAIDSLFAVIEDLSAIFNQEVFQRAKVAMFLAVVVWLAPLTVILTPATLTVEPSILTNVTTCSSVRTLNFTPETTNDWRQPKKISGLYELSLSYWNTTSTNTSDPYFFDYYDGPSQPVQQVATLSAYLQRTIMRENASVDICGAGWNCSFTISFTGPGYKCSSTDAGGLTTMDAPFNTSDLVPEGNFSYFALTYLGDYAPIQVPSGDAGIPLGPTPYPADLGAFRTEPVLWIGYATLQNSSNPLPSNSSDPSWSSAFESSIFFCEHYETHYTVLFNYSSGLQSASVTNRTFLSPIINTTFVPNENAMDGTEDNTTATPAGNYIYPTDVANYRLTAAYHSLGAMLRQFVNGTIDFYHPGVPITKTAATQTRLIDPHFYLAVPDLMDQVQLFYEDIILSLFSNPQFLVVAWAANSSELSGTLSNTPDGMYSCTKSRMFNRFVYLQRDLWLVYGLTILTAGLAVAIGAAAISRNAGKLRNTRFSSIVAATRGPGLDQLAWRRTSAWGEVPRDVCKVRLGYGLIGHGNSASDSVGEIWMDYHYGFGVEGEVRQGSGGARNIGNVRSFRRWVADRMGRGFN